MYKLQISSSLHNNYRFSIMFHLRKIISIFHTLKLILKNIIDKLQVSLIFT